MNPKHLSTLEFPRVLEKLARYTSFSVSKELALALTPSTILPEARQRQAETSEARRLLSLQPEVGIGGARDLRPYLQQAALSAALLPAELLDVKQTLVASRNLKRIVTRLADQLPCLTDVADRMDDCANLVEAIDRSISERGDVLDSASPALGRLRREMEIAHQRLLDRLNRIVQSSDNKQYLQESFVTQRQGRYVIPLRAEFKGRIQGVVHDQSASGATLFIEPLATVELNNQWRQLQLEEEQEVRRILLDLSQLVHAEAAHILWTLEALAELDLALAKAKYADSLDGVEALWLTGDGASRGHSKSAAPSSLPFTLLAARHPLLNPEKVVPIDVMLAPDVFVLVITGPNTGGKTVTLKTIGLAVAMGQAGLHLPAAEGSTLPFYHAIYADIGDEQSIEQSLSTFSSHMTNIVNILSQCDEYSLVILDELGAGTDPVEGSALARALLEYLNEKKVTTMVATHYSELKAFAHHTPGVVNASVEFDNETLAPTYRLSIGLPGRSNALAIAQRLGLDVQIVQSAQLKISPEVRQTEAMLEDIQAQLDAAKQERSGASSTRALLEKRLEELDRRLTGIDKERREVLNTARADARREIETTREELRRLRDEWIVPARQPLGQETAVSPAPDAAKADETLKALEAQVTPEEPPEEPAGSRYRGPLKPGDQVWVEPLQSLGEVISSQRGQVEIQMGRFRTTARRSQVELRQPQSSDEEQDKQAEATGRVDLPARESPGMEIDLRGQTTEECLHNLEFYLDNAYLAELPWVRIIHGKGSGILRTAVREALKDHPLVSSYQSGDDKEGGEGVTVVKLAHH